ncbi:MAG: hypothetical protein ED556_02200 [Winogradskyella sp.]|uniref:hypothetical protein n=1 Tax=Winogradskyella sp. TaxID=1883156 RepID=UPI000F3FEE18|nr:hypothetical protein [Winogradskyella sp.]RNC88023.1 MAG: hypothetical protein ED556_02200 [Winogradskyella sp.]
MIQQDLQHSDYRIRKLIGTLGLLLPLTLPLAKGEVLASISHYYYSTLSSLIFIIVLAAFGLFLLSYKGYKIDKTTETISDDLLTNIGGLAALIVVFIPTICCDSSSDSIQTLCKDGPLPLFGHKNETLNLVHLVAAGIFILCMGWMSRYKFTRGSDDGNHGLYKWCGNLVFISVGLIIVFIILEKLEVNFPLKDYYVFIFETTAVIPFGISWLIKGRAIDDVKMMSRRMFGIGNDN